MSVFDFYDLTDAAAALAHKRRWGGGSNASDSSQVAAEMAEPHSESVVCDNLQYMQYV